MPLRYKIDVLAALKAAGYNTSVLRDNKIMGEGTIQHLRNGNKVSWETIETVCRLLNCQPADIIEYVGE